MLGPDQPVIIHMLDIEPAAEALKGVKMELIDAALPLLKGKKLLNFTKFYQTVQMSGRSNSRREKHSDSYFPLLNVIVL